VRISESLIVRRRFREFGCTPGDFTSDQRLMAKNILETIAQLTADLSDALVRCTAMWAGVTAVLDQRDRRVRRADNMIPPGVDGPGETIRRRWLRRLTTFHSLLRWMHPHAGRPDEPDIENVEVIQRN
jgi:hypothetical protein